jgi:hypothetical protein
MTNNVPSKDSFGSITRGEWVRVESVCRKPDHPHDRRICGLDVGPEVAFHSGRNKKEKMKKLQIAILTVGLTVALSASAQIYTGTDLSGLTPSTPYGPGSDSQYVPASGSTPALWALYTSDSGALETSGDIPAVFVLGPLGTLSSFSASYSLYGAATGPSGVEPYWNIKVSPDANPADVIHIISMGGSPLNGSSAIHAYNADYSAAVGTWGMTLSALGAITYGGYMIGDMTVNAAGVEIGNWDNGASIIPASANFDSITVVPEPTMMTMLVGALLLLPFSMRMLRKTRTQ